MFVSIEANTILLTDATPDKASALLQPLQPTPLIKIPPLQQLYIPLDDVSDLPSSIPHPIHASTRPLAPFDDVSTLSHVQAIDQQVQVCAEGLSCIELNSRESRQHRVTWSSERSRSSSLELIRTVSSFTTDNNEVLAEGMEPLTALGHGTAAAMSFKAALMKSSQDIAPSSLISRSDSVVSACSSLEYIPPAAAYKEEHSTIIPVAATESLRLVVAEEDAPRTTYLPELDSSVWIPACKGGRHQKQRVAEALEKAAIDHHHIVLAVNKFDCLLESDQIPSADVDLSENKDEIVPCIEQGSHSCCPSQSTVDFTETHCLQSIAPLETSPRQRNWLKKLPGRVVRGVLRIGKACVVAVPKGIMCLACMGSHPKLDQR